MSPPRFSTSISLGNVLTVVVFMIGGIFAYADTQSQVRENSNRLGVVVQATADQEVRLRSAETQIARGDERMSSILTLLGRIDARLERIERTRGAE